MPRHWLIRTLIPRHACRRPRSDGRPLLGSGISSSKEKSGQFFWLDWLLRYPTANGMDWGNLLLRLFASQFESRLSCAVHESFHSIFALDHEGWPGGSDRRPSANKLPSSDIFWPGSQPGDVRDRQRQMLELWGACASHAEGNLGRLRSTLGYSPILAACRAVHVK